MKDTKEALEEMLVAIADSTSTNGLLELEKIVALGKSRKLIPKTHKMVYCGLAAIFDGKGQDDVEESMLDFGRLHRMDCDSELVKHAIVGVLVIQEGGNGDYVRSALE